MTQLYYRDLRRRVGPLEALYFPEEERLPTLVFTDDDGLPFWVCIPTEFDWVRRDREPIPPKVLAMLDPEIRAMYEARLVSQLESEKRGPFRERLPGAAEKSPLKVKRAETTEGARVTACGRPSPSGRPATRQSPRLR
jgi:hypothetical protein